MGLGTPGGMAYFLAGFGSAFLFYWIWCQLKHRRFLLNWRYVGIAMGIIVIAFVSIQTQSAYKIAQETALEVQDCQREFNQSLQDRVRISNENEELSKEQRSIVYNWIHNLIFPPMPYSGMASDDPRRQAYSLALTINTDHEFTSSIQKQTALQQERDRHPLPDPTCGK